jgi:hypothetical protein
MKSLRTDSGSGEIVFLADSAFDPPPSSLVNRFLAVKNRSDSPALNVELVRFDVGISNSEIRDIYSQSPPIFIAPGAPIAANAIGNLLGQLAVAAFDGHASNQTVVVKIEVRALSREFEISDFGVLYSGRSITEAIQAVVPRALASLSGQIAAAP